MAGYLHHVLAALLGIDGHAYLGANDLELLDGGGAVHVAGHEQGFLARALLEAVGELAGEGGLTRALESGHEDDRGLAREVEPHALASHQGGELVVHDLHHELAGLHGGEHVHAHRLLLHGVGKLLGHFVVDIGVEQCPAYILECLGYVDLGDFSLTFQYLERAF